MKLKALLISFLTMLIIGSGLHAQDIHFSQYYASPLTLNPALTGKFNGLYRVTAIYRDQWRNLNPGNQAIFMTPSASVDFSLLKNKLKTDALGIGAHVVYDKDGEFEQYVVGLSLAYHKGLDKNGKYHLGIGVQGNYINDKLGLDPMTSFEDNLGLQLPSADIAKINFNSEHLFDINTGLFFDARFSEKATFYAGGTFFHIPRPKRDYIVNDETLESAEAETPWKWVAHGGLELLFKNKIYLIPGALYQRTENQNEEINFGVTAGYDFMEKKQNDKQLILFLGGWYRWDDAVIAKAGVDFQNFRITGAYDITLSQLKDDAQAAPIGKIPTAFEIAISYFGDSKPVSDDLYLFNPRF